MDSFKQLDSSVINDPSVPAKCIIHKQEIQKLGVKLEVLEEQNRQRGADVDKICNKLEQTADNLQKLSLNITKMITIHDQRIKQNEHFMENLAVEKSETSKILESSIRLAENRIQNTESDIHRVDEKIIGLSNSLSTKLEKIDDSIQNMGDRLTRMEVWRYLILGGAVVVIFLISNADKFLHILQRLIHT